MGRKIKKLVKSLDKDLNSYDLKAQGYEQVREFGYISTDPEKLITQEQIVAAGYSTPQYTPPKSGKLLDSGTSVFRKKYDDAKAELIKVITDKGRKEENGIVVYRTRQGVDVNVSNSFIGGYDLRWIDFVIEGVVLQKTSEKNKSYSSDDAERKQFLDKLSKMVESGGGQYWFDAFMVFADKYYLKSADLKNYSMNKPGRSNYNKYLTEQGKARGIDVNDYLIDEAAVAAGKTIELQTDNTKKFDNLLKFEFYILNDGPKSSTSDNDTGLLKRMDTGYLEHLKFFLETFPKDNTERYEILYEAFLDAGDDYKGPYTEQILNPSQVSDNKNKDKTVLGTECAILEFAFDNIKAKAVISKTDVSIKVPYGTDVRKLVALFKLSPGATATVNVPLPNPVWTINGFQTVNERVTQVSGQTQNDFTRPLSYEVTAEDLKTTVKYLITVNVEPEPAVNLGRPEYLGTFTFSCINDVDVKVVDTKVDVVQPDGTIKKLTNAGVPQDVLTLVEFGDDDIVDVRNDEKTIVALDQRDTLAEYESIDSEYIDVEAESVSFKPRNNENKELGTQYLVREGFPTSPSPGQIFEKEKWNEDEKKWYRIKYQWVVENGRGAWQQSIDAAIVVANDKIRSEDVDKGTL